MDLKPRQTVIDKWAVFKRWSSTAAYCRCYFLKKFLGHKSSLWGTWYPCFELLVTSPLGFKTRVGSLIWTLQRHTWYIYLRFTSGATPLPVYNASIAAGCLQQMHVSVEMGCGNLNCRPPAWQSDALPTRPRWSTVVVCLIDKEWCRVDYHIGKQWGALATTGLYMIITAG